MVKGIFDRLVGVIKREGGRGLGLDCLIKKQIADTGSSAFTVPEAQDYLFSEGIIWTDHRSFLTRKVEQGKIIHGITTDEAIRMMLRKETQRCLASSRVKGNGKSLWSCRLASVPLDWRAPHIYSRNLTERMYMDRDEFERRSIAAMGQDEFLSWRKAYSVRHPKGTGAGVQPTSRTLDLGRVTQVAPNAYEIQVLKASNLTEIGKISYAVVDGGVNVQCVTGDVPNLVIERATLRVRMEAKLDDTVAEPAVLQTSGAVPIIPASQDEDSSSEETPSESPVEANIAVTGDEATEVPETEMNAPPTDSDAAVTNEAKA